MGDWPMLVGVAVLMLTGYLGAGWSLREPDNVGAIRRVWRKSIGRLRRFRGAFESLPRTRRIVALWLAVISLLMLTRAVFAVAKAAHTEQGVIVSLLLLAAVAIGGSMVGVNSLIARTRRRSM